MERILLEVKNAADRFNLEEWLARDYQLLVSENEEGLSQAFDLAVLDGVSLKKMRAEVRSRRQAEEPVLLPFLLVTVRRKGNWPVRHLGPLVDDVIIRPLDAAEVRARVANLLRMRKLSLQLKKEHDLVQKLSVTDDVSGFYNTRYMHRYLDRFFSSPAPDHEVSLVFFDLDNFKHVVDSYGHLLGGKALKEVAQVVHRLLDDHDRLVRYGGDEYVVILPHQGKDAALQKVERMKEAIAETPFLHKEGLDVHIAASFGLATYPHDAATKRELLARADQCLFHSKAEGKNRISVAAPAEEQPTVPAVA